MFASVALGLAGCAAPAPQPVDVSAKSAVLVDRFQADLPGQLQAAMKAGGPVGAIGVGQQAAPAIAANLSEESGAEVRRIALKERNPAAAPEGELRDRLEQLAAAGVPSHVSVAPVIPAITDEYIERILEEAAARGVTTASWIMLRLPHG